MSATTWLTRWRWELAVAAGCTLLAGVDLAYAGSAVFSDDDGKYLAWVLDQLEAGRLSSYATRTSHAVGHLPLGGASALLLLPSLALGAPPVEAALWTSAIASVAVLWLLFDLGRLLYSPMAGGLAALAFMPQQSTELRTRELTFLVPLMLLALDLGVRLSRGRRDLTYVPLALALGLMTSAHYQGLLLLLASIAALAVAYRDPPAARPAVLLSVVAIAVVCSATALSASSQLPLWLLYLVPLAALPWVRWPATRLTPALVAAGVLVAAACAPAALIDAIGNLLSPALALGLPGACLALGAIGWLALAIVWGVRRCTAAEPTAALITTFVLVVLVIGSTLLSTVFDSAWRDYWFAPLRAVLALSAGVAVARGLAWLPAGPWTRRAAVGLGLAVAALVLSDAVLRRVERDNPYGQMTLGEARSVVDALARHDGAPVVRDAVSRFNRDAPHLRLLYRLRTQAAVAPDRELVAYLQQAHGRFAGHGRALQRLPHRYSQQIGKYVLIWFERDPDRGPAPPVALAQPGGDSSATGAP